MLVSHVVSDKRGILFLFMFKFVFRLYLISVYICVDLLCWFCQYLSGSKQGILCRQISRCQKGFPNNFILLLLPAQYQNNWNRQEDLPISNFSAKTISTATASVINFCVNHMRTIQKSRAPWVPVRLFFPLFWPLLEPYSFAPAVREIRNSLWGRC